MSVEALCQYFGLPTPSGLYQAEALETPSEIIHTGVAGEATLRRAMLRTLDLQDLTKQLKASPSAFEELRRAYHYPREMSAYRFAPSPDADLTAALLSLGFTPK